MTEGLPNANGDEAEEPRELVARTGAPVRATVAMTDQVSCHAGSGLCTEPQAQTAPETMPSSGGSSVNGRASWV